MKRTSGSRTLFWLGIVLAVLLLALIVLTPLVEVPEETQQGWQRLVGLFARDATLRRTCIASAVGLVVSAFVFFRPKPVNVSAGQAEALSRSRRRDVAGA